MTGSCCGSHVALSGSAPESSRLLLVPQHLVSQALVRQIIHSVMRRRMTVTKTRPPVKSRHVLYSSQHSTLRTLFTTRATGLGSGVVKRRTVVAAKYCQ